MTTFSWNNLSYLHAEGFYLHKHTCNHSVIKQNKKLGRFSLLNKDIQILLHVTVLRTDTGRSPLAFSLEQALMFLLFPLLNINMKSIY